MRRADDERCLCPGHDAPPRSNSLASILAMAFKSIIRMSRQVPCLWLSTALANAARWIAQKALQALRGLAEWKYRPRVDRSAWRVSVALLGHHRLN